LIHDLTPDTHLKYVWDGQRISHVYEVRPL
jgi:hypothetical protein